MLIADTGGVIMGTRAGDLDPGGLVPSTVSLKSLTYFAISKNSRALLTYGLNAVRMSPNSSLISLLR
jgi:hypothetical protein